VSDFIVSILETVADAAAAAKARRDAAQGQPAPPRRFERAPPPPEPLVQAAPPSQPPVPAALEPRSLEIRRLFAGPESLVRTVVAAEILGPPLALRRQNFWDPPGV